MIDYKYAYLFGNLVFAFPVWLLLFLRRKDLRKEILIISSLGGFLGPVSELWYLRDYWSPLTFNTWTIGLEDALFGFFVSGIAASVYTGIYNKQFYGKENKNIKIILGITSAVLMVILLVSFFVFVLGINSIYSSIIASLILSFYMIITRRDLVKDALMSGVIISLLMLIVYVVFLIIFPDLINRFWFSDNISGILLLGVPIEEPLWGFAAGMVIGPLYEFMAGLKLKDMD